MKNSTIFKIAIAALILSIISYFIFTRGKAEGEPILEAAASTQKKLTIPADILKNHPIKTVSLKMEGDYEQVNLPGTVSYDLAKVARVGSRVGGRLVHIHVNEGDYVKKGQPVFSISSIELGDMESMYRKALARKEALFLQAERAKELYEKKVTSAKEYEVAMMDYKTVKTELETSRSALENYGLNQSEIVGLESGKSYSLNLPIRSPISGTVTERNAVLGQAVSVRDNLFTIADLTTLWIMLDVYEKDLNQIRIGTEAKVMPVGATDSSDEITAKVAHVGEIIDPVKRTAELRLVVKNAKGKLRPGQSISAVVQGLVSSDEKKKFYSLPSVCVHSIEGEKIVFIRNDDGSFTAKKVETGQAVDDRIEIISGIELTDEVISDGSFLLKSEYLKI
ncbi:efflux RND transporter periplasmic adaptor subunit [Leptospira sp. GIMC2001]|uniref:efflux RND transporter periplasmic adaptor subunit n=1 Tax=Leptospira sp. GIMC2001 TaxID=1513297 RepID=UPI0004A5C53F|nr:efflux RND transporter periplasmic adaptor subunit [Leptospira sp. GIMC2001]AID56175.1 cobalt/zinc/cadmium efflux RND transporter [Leptospira sp. GIMC2001]WCL48180.1 efflux RND transporter periplasmic adaptor subunit [Leptospira sp. GIMC2001]